MNIARALRAIAPDLPKGKNFAYTLRLPESSGAIPTLIHYGVQPAILVKNIFDTKKDVDTLHKMAPEKLQQMGFSSEEAGKIYRRQRGAVAGRAIGNLASWGLYPLSMRNSLLHYPITVGGSLAAPRIGESIGKATS